MTLNNAYQNDCLHSTLCKECLPCREKGFTFIELFMVVMIVAILVTLAFPSYIEYVRKSRRPDAQSYLVEIAQGQEKYYASNATYTTDLTDLGYANSASNTSPEGYYVAQVLNATSACPIARCFVLQATPVSGSDQASDLIEGYQLSSSGLKRKRTDGSWKNGW